MIKTKLSHLLRSSKAFLCTVGNQHRWGETECTVFTQTTYIRKPEHTASPSYTEVLDEKQIIYVETISHCKRCNRRKVEGFAVNRVKEADICELLIVATKRTASVKKVPPCH